MRDDGRYRIEDEPSRLPVQGVDLLIFLSLPVTIYFSLVYSLFFLFIPGVLGLLIGGRHRWRDPLACLAAFVIYHLINIGGGMLMGMGLDGLPLEYVRDLHIALTGLPLFWVAMQQQRTMQLRAAAAL